MIQSSIFLNLSDTKVQYRFDSQQNGGIISNVKTNVDFYISSSLIIGYSFLENEDNGYLIQQIQVAFINININSVKICSNIIKSVGQRSQLLYLLSEDTIIQCENICSLTQIVVYGLCKSNLQYGTTNTNATMSCISPFVFDGVDCVCQSGYILNLSQCVNLLDKFNSIQDNIKINNLQINQYLISNISNLNNTIQHSLQNLITSFNSNFSQITNQIQLTSQNLQNEIFNVKEKVVNNEQRFQNDLMALNIQLFLKIEELSNRINQLKDATDLKDSSQDTVISSIQTKLDVLNSTIKSNKDATDLKDSSQDTVISSIQTKLDVLNSTIKSNKDATDLKDSSQDTVISSIQTKLDVLNSTIKSNKDATDLKDSSQDTVISSIQTKLDVLNSTIKSNKDATDLKDSSQDTVISQIKAHVDSLNNIVVSNKNAIDQKNANQDTDITNLRNQVNSISSSTVTVNYGRCAGRIKICGNGLCGETGEASNIYGRC
ncbi:Conserved_hypothetical protein [Hexamita inflata]|uniref:Uncharacterized protein n=1 Tax=Hexamita inflata TaxID=28002 RepID=A0ABP1K164_9EUKA